MNTCGIIIGCSKSGTTSLYRYLTQPRDIAACREKEPNFFANDKNWQRGFEWYKNLWERLVLWCEICVDLLSGPNRNSRSAIPVSIGALEPVEPKITPAVMDESTLSTEELFLVFCCTIDELYQKAAPDRVRTRPGSDRLEMTDAEIITLSVMQEGRSNDSELSFHRMVKKDYQHLFPDLISRSHYHRRRKDLMGIQREILRLLMDRLQDSGAWLIVDSAPITIAESPRWKSARMSICAAEAGYCPSKRQFFLGFRLHALVSNTGAICDFVLSPANVGERRVAEHLLAVESDRTKLRPVLAVGGLLRGPLGEPLRAERRTALVRPSAKPVAEIDRRDGASGLASGKAGKN